MISDPLTIQEVAALPPLVDIRTAARALSLSRASAYRLAQTGEFPVPVLRIGQIIRVKSSDLRALLGLHGAGTTATPPQYDPGRLADAIRDAERVGAVVVQVIRAILERLDLTPEQASRASAVVVTALKEATR